MSSLRSLSPSRAADFKSCPLLFRFRTIDRLPEPPSPAAVRGTLVHGVLERLFDLPAPARTVDACQTLLGPVWQELRAADPELESLFAPPVTGGMTAAPPVSETPPVSEAPVSEAEWLASARTLLDTYFRLEDPTGVEPVAREERVEVESGELLLRGIIDRIDMSPAGEIRIVDYKTGASPREAFEGKALFQMKFYALVVWKLRGQVPRLLRLMYLADGDTLSYRPDAAELERFERTLVAVGQAISRAVATQDFRPSPSRLCDWCCHRALCPAWGGTAPAYPVDVEPSEPELAQL